ncbi:MAG: hypothetical protein AVDCRST_MAG02-1359, partial [uncultured Rubrobacteraceae bacterium]
GRVRSSSGKRAGPDRGRIPAGSQELRGVREKDPEPLAGEKQGEEPPHLRAGTAGSRPETPAARGGL